MKCSFCNRTLKSQESIKRGAGRVCFKKKMNETPDSPVSYTPQWREIAQIAVQSDSPIDWYMSLDEGQIKPINERMKAMDGSTKEKLQVLFESFKGGSNIPTYAPVNSKAMDDVEIGEPQIAPSDITFRFNEKHHATASAEYGGQIVLGEDIYSFIEQKDNREGVRHVLSHELGHVISNAFPALERHVMDNPQGALGKANLKKGKFEGLFGGFHPNESPEESWAEGFAMYVNSPDELKERFPKTYQFVEVMVKEKLGEERVQSYLAVIDRQLNEWYKK